MSRPSTIVISDWLASCRAGQWTPFEAATALKATLTKEGYVIIASKPVAYRWRWPHIYHWTIRSFAEPPHGAISEPLYTTDALTSADQGSPK